MTINEPLIKKINNNHFELGAFTVSMFNPNISISWELTGPQIEPVMSDDRDTLLKIALYLVNIHQQADLYKELFRLVAIEMEEKVKK